MSAYKQSIATLHFPASPEIGVMQNSVDAGKVKAVGVSEVSPDELRLIHSIVPVKVVEMEWSLFARKNEVSVRKSVLGSGSCPLIIITSYFMPVLMPVRPRGSCFQNFQLPEHI